MGQNKKPAQKPGRRMAAMQFWNCLSLATCASLRGNRDALLDHNFIGPHIAQHVAGLFVQQIDIQKLV